MLRARLREVDVATRLGVDPKSVRRWLNGRVPYPSSRAALADLVGADEADLWPDAGGPLSGQARPQELAAVYPHRWAIPRHVWTGLLSQPSARSACLPTVRSFLLKTRDCST